MTFPGPPSPNAKRGRPKRLRTLRCDDDEDRHIAPPSTRSKRSVPKNNERRSQNRQVSTHQIITTDVNIGETMEANGLLDRDSTRPVQAAPSRWSDVAKCGSSSESISRECLIQRIVEFSRARKIVERTSSVEMELNRFLDTLERAHHDEISGLKHAHEAEIVSLKHAAHSLEVISAWEHKCDSLLEQKSMLQKENEESNLRSHKLVVENKVLQEKNEKLILPHKCAVKRIREFEGAVKAIVEGLKNSFTESVQATPNSVSSAKPYRRNKDLQQDIKQIESDRTTLLLELQNCSREHECSEKLQPKQAHGNEFEGAAQASVDGLKNSFIDSVQATPNSIGSVKLRPCNKHLQQNKQIESDSPALILALPKSFREHKSSEKQQQEQTDGNDKVNTNLCGSYTDGAPRPALLHGALSSTRAAVTTFQRVLLDSVRSLDKPCDLLAAPNVFLVRRNHLSHYFKSVVNRVFFEGFENESFIPTSVVSSVRDPRSRQGKLNFQYYLRERHQQSVDGIEDIHFKEFCDMKASSILQEIFRACATKQVKVPKLEQLGSAELISSFKATARTVWLLHKLAFSFEIPAAVITFEKGVDLHPDCMESTIVKLDDHERLVSKVGFMIDPGLRLNREIIMRCDVYLDASPTLFQIN